MQSRFIKQTLALLAAVVVVAGCGGGGSAGGGTGDGGSAATEVALSVQAQLGAKIFVDQSLSFSGKQSCQSCHEPANAHGAPNDGHASRPGGKDTLPDQGDRSSPSIRYLRFNSSFYFANDGTPTGGFFWDGRATSLKDQSGGPFVNPDEMANDSIEDVIAKLAKASYAAEFRQVFGDDIFSRPQDAYDRLKVALQAFEQEDPAFAPFSSKYDAYLDGKATLTAAEQRGLVLFNSPAKGNCAACHPSAKGADGSHPLFTDFSYDALGVPRNPMLRKNAKADYNDLGLCAVAGFEGRTDLCGAFKVPSLRNVAARGSFFHNGRFADLREVLSFYVTRDTNPERWYTQADGSVVKFDDLPENFRRNVNRTEAPYNRQAGDAPALTEAEIDDLLAFLKTLTDADVTAR